MRNDFSSRVQSGFGRLGGRLSVVLIGLGLLSIGIAWNGAAGTPAVAAQLPYLVSGGLVGVCLVTVGTGLLVLQGYREERTRLEAKLDQLIFAVQRSGGGLGGGMSAAAPRDLTGLVAAGSASYHEPGCRLVDGREEVDYLTPEEAQARFLQPCRVCQPAQASNVSVV
jgi:hypothetical protein